jgi:LysM repeat protein
MQSRGRARRLLHRVAAVLCLGASVAGCGYDAVVHSWFDRTGGPGQQMASQKLPGHVYLLRGVLGEVYSLGVDQIADKISHRGLVVSVDAYDGWDKFADEIISKYQSGEEHGPVLLVGHSTGGDRLIAMAGKLKVAGIPVPAAISIDPTRMAPLVPSNVDLYINVYQRFNPIGGGEISAAPDFRGRLINVDMHEHHDLVHINLDKAASIQDLVADKVAAVAADVARQAIGVGPAAGARRLVRGPEVRPLLVKYSVPAEAQIVLWDSAIEVKPRPDDTLESIASANGVPVWAIAQINKIDQDHPFDPGRSLLIPHNQYLDTTLPGPPQVAARKLPAGGGGASNVQTSQMPRTGAAGANVPQATPDANSFTDRWRAQPAQ